MTHLRGFRNTWFVSRALRQSFTKKPSYRIAVFLLWASVGSSLLFELLGDNSKLSLLLPPLESAAGLATLALVGSLRSEPTTRDALTQMAELRGYDKTAVSWAPSLARFELSLRLVSLPLFPLGILLGVQLATPTEQATFALRLGGAALAGAIFALACALLARGALILSPRHPVAIFLLLIYVPALCHFALPSIPSLLDLHAWLVSVSLT